VLVVTRTVQGTHAATQARVCSVSRPGATSLVGRVGIAGRRTPAAGRDTPRRPGQGQMHLNRSERGKRTYASAAHLMPGPRRVGALCASGDVHTPLPSRAFVLPTAKQLL
jgi:hypothetical protein